MIILRCTSGERHRTCDSSNTAYNATEGRLRWPPASSQRNPHPACLHGCIHGGVTAQGNPVDGLRGRAQVGGDDQALEAVHKLRVLVGRVPLG